MQTHIPTIKSATSLKARLQCLTLTGIDASVPVEALYEVTRHYSFAEFGVLYSAKQNGLGRYPTLGWMDDLVEALDVSPGPRMALHVCGAAVGELIAGSGHVSTIAHAFKRIQLNFTVNRYPVASLRQLLQRMPETTFITQSRYPDDAANLWLDFADLPNHAVLFDASGGNAITPAALPVPLDISMAVSGFKEQAPLCGYAGGLGHENLGAHLQSIASITGRSRFWLDIESSLRVNDKFDVRLALKCLDTVAMAMEKENSQPQDCRAKACWQESCMQKQESACAALAVAA